MDLWIRTQDKLNLEKTTAFEIDEQENPVIYIRNFNGTLVFAGQYKDMERAFEVLNEIQGRISQNECLKTMILKLTNIKGEEEKIGKLFKDMVYVMPKE